MGYHTIPGTAQTYALIAYDAGGHERPEAGGLFTQSILNDLAAGEVTNVFFFVHGWKGDLPAAIDQYDRWIGALVRSAGMARAASVFPGFRPFFIGLHWPSLPFGAEEAGPSGSFAAGPQRTPDQLLADYLDRLGDTPAVRTPLETIFAEARRNMAPDSLPRHVRAAYLELNEALGLGSGGADEAPDADRAPFDPDETYEVSQDQASFGDFNFGGLLGPLRQLSYWTMKKRARSVGEGGMHEFLRTLQDRTNARVHLMGHSFGTVVVSGMLGGPDGRGPLVRPVDSVALVQGAVSLWSYSPAIPIADGKPGYFSRNLSAGKVAGPLIVTRSRFDTAVGVLYPLASRISGSASFQAGMPEYGALGAYGMQGLDSSVQVDTKMLPVGGEYGFGKGKIYNLESSEFICRGGGLSGAHSDIDGPEVAHAIWEAAFAAV